MRDLDKRLSALEAYIETRVGEGLRRELEAALEILEERLTREEFVRVARILAEMGGGSDGAGHFNAPQVTLESLSAQLSKNPVC
jgi:hypothetical protein